MKVLLIGPLPLPINGCSHANQILLKSFKHKNISHEFINTNTNLISGKQGHTFSFQKAIPFFKTYLGLYKVCRVSIVYLTPGQTFFGICKYSPFIVLCRLLQKPYVIHLHGNHLGKEYQLLRGAKKGIFGFLISGASAGIVLSESLRANFDKLLPYHKIHIVENFVDDILTRQLLQKNKQQLRILYMSNLMREKGILDLLDGLIALKRRNINFHATLAGALEKGIEKEFTERYTMLGGQIEYLGTVVGERKSQVLNEANVFILPTYYKMEGQPICLLEGMATGNIIITTVHAGIPDVVNESNGFFIKKQSSEEIAACLEKINHNLSSMVMLFSEHNINYMAWNFTEKKFTDKVLTILHATAKSQRIQASR